MEEKKEIENYLKNLYEFYEKSNYKYFVEKCLSFNIKIGDYNKNISSLSKKVYEFILNQLLVNNSRVEYKECNSYYYLNVLYSDNKFLDNNIIVDIPLFEENYEHVANIIFSYLNDNKINFSMKFYKLLKNSFFKIVFYDVGQFKRFSDFFNMNSEIVATVKSRVIPFLNKTNYLGIYTEIEPYSFKNFYLKNLYLYFDHYSNNPSEDGVTLDGFLYFITNKVKTSRNNLNEKRMYSILMNYLEISINSIDISYLFQSNTVMNLGSYSPNDYILKMNNYKMIYFINKDDGEQIEYGSEDFLNIAYSKYYENVIKRETNNKFYFDFYNIYNSILCSQYKNTDALLSLINDKMDIINKLLIILSSAFFAHKKMNFPIKTVYTILDSVVPKIYTYTSPVLSNINNNSNSVSINSDNNESVVKVSNEYILSDELANKLVDLYDGKKISFKDYLNQYDILSSIKVDTIIHMKDGTVTNGKDFIDNLYKHISFYNSFSELFDDMVSMIEYK